MIPVHHCLSIALAIVCYCFFAVFAYHPNPIGAGGVLSDWVNKGRTPPALETRTLGPPLVKGRVWLSRWAGAEQTEETVPPTAFSCGEVMEMSSLAEGWAPFALGGRSLATA